MTKLNSITPRWLAAGLVLALTPAVQSAENPPVTISATDLAARLTAIVQNGNSYVRMRLDVKGTAQETLQIQIKQRRTKSSTEVVYQVLWPKERKAEAVLLRKAGNKPIGGAVFIPPNNLRTIDAENMKDPLLGSDLAYEDVVENFWAWDQQSIVGTEEIDGVMCQILESKPGKSEHSIYGSVRSWIDTRRIVPLRVEKLSTSGQPLRRIDTTRVVGDNGHQIPANLTVRRAGQSSTTTVDGSRIKHDVNYTDREFTSDGLKELTPPRDGAE